MIDVWKEKFMKVSTKDALWVDKDSELSKS